MPPAARAILTALALAAAFPAGAFGATLTNAGKAFGPADVSVAPGDSVTWNWSSGPHNVHVMSGPETFDSGIKDAGGTYTRQLTAAGTYTYQCDVHPSMRGTVVVGAPAAGPAGIDTAPPALRAVKVSRLAVVHLSASAPGTLAIRILRGTRVARRSSAPLAPGANRLPLSVRGLARGRYSVRLQAVSAAGQQSAPVVRSLLVTRAALARRPAAAPGPAAASPAPGPPAAAPADDHGSGGAHHTGNHGRGREDRRVAAPVA
jgi:plastocyanin